MCTFICQKSTSLTYHINIHIRFMYDIFRNKVLGWSSKVCHEQPSHQETLFSNHDYKHNPTSPRTDRRTCNKSSMQIEFVMFTFVSTFEHATVLQIFPTSILDMYKHQMYMYNISPLVEIKECIHVCQQYFVFNLHVIRTYTRQTQRKLLL